MLRALFLRDQNPKIDDREIVTHSEGRPEEDPLCKL
jgi:hypothetical protein